jgi:uncharacterized membrane protein
MSRRSLKFGRGISHSRPELLFDGIFTIAMTLLVLELKVPELADPPSIVELAHALGHHAPTFGNCVLSFVVLGVFWYTHNHRYANDDRIGRGVLALHLIQLAAAAFFPFAAAMLGRDPLNPLSLLVYLGDIGLFVGSSCAAWAVAHQRGPLRAGLTPEEYRSHRSRLVRGSAMLLLFALTAMRAAGRVLR